MEEKKKRLTRSEAGAIVKEAREVLLNPLNERGILVIGSRNLDGELITEEWLAEFHKEIDGIVWGILERGCIIVED